MKCLFIEAGFEIDESELVDQAMIALPGPDYADAMIATHRNAAKPGDPTSKEAARDKYEFSMKDHWKHAKKEVGLVVVKESVTMWRARPQGIGLSTEWG